MQALGFIETRGLIVAIESADAMLKAAEVTLIEKSYTGGGLVSIVITGDVAAVKAAIEAGAAAVRQIKNESLVSQHVIPRPHEELNGLIGLRKSQDIGKIQTFESMGNKSKDNLVSKEVEQEKESEIKALLIEEIKQEPASKGDELDKKHESKGLVIEESKQLQIEKYIDKLNKTTIDTIAQEYGLEEIIKFLSTLSVARLRKLAREYKKLGLAGRLISKANKEILLSEFKKYYNNNLKS